MIKIQVIYAETDEVVKELEATSKRDAEKIEDGLNRQLNHEKYYTQIVEESK